MATYRNKNDDTIIRGSEFKLNISMDAIDGYHMGTEGVDFSVTFKAGGKTVTLSKDEGMIFVDNDNYVAPLDSTELGKGALSIRYTTDIPDSDFDTAGNADGKRREIIDIPTKIKIV